MLTSVTVGSSAGTVSGMPDTYTCGDLTDGTANGDREIIGTVLGQIGGLVKKIYYI